MNDRALSETPISIPADAEKPRSQIDQKLETLEEDTLEKQAKSAAYRDALERRQHLESLNRRIDKLQGKLDQRESELQIALPKLASLEQAMRGVNASLLVGPVIMAVGGGAISYAPMTDPNYMSQQSLSGAGVASLIIGGVVTLMAFYVKRPVR